MRGFRPGSEGSGGGNTKTPPGPQRITASKKWAFTYNNWSESELAPILKSFDRLAKKYVIGKEVGEQGTPHLQGYVEFIKKERPLECIKSIKIHWEKAKGDEKQNFNYCTKEDKSPFVKGFVVLIDPFLGLNPKDWQKDILRLIERPCKDLRSIHWYWDSKGKIGKTTLAKHICMNHNAILVSGKASDIKYAIGNWVEEKGGIDICIFHFTKTQEEFVSYEAIESIKDGIFFGGKYESKMVMFNSPHIIVFANFKPDTEKMMKDRWKIEDLTGN